MLRGLKAHSPYHRHNLLEELLVEIFSTSQPTVSQSINSIEKPLPKLFLPADSILR